MPLLSAFSVFFTQCASFFDSQKCIHDRVAGVRPCPFIWESLDRRS